MASRRKSLSVQIQDEIHERIINNVYKVGEYLPSEATLCEEFGVSRTTIRDAISGLAEKGFVRREHGKGIMVINHVDTVVANSLMNMMLLGDYSVSEFLETREMIERQMAYFAAQRATLEQIKSLDHCISMMKKNSGCIEQYTKYDLQFHKEIAIASQNQLLITVYDAIQPMLQQMVSSVIQSTGTVEEELGYHAKILDCIKNRDSEGAQSRTTDHDKCSEKMFKESMEQDITLDIIINQTQKQN